MRQESKQADQGSRRKSAKRQVFICPEANRALTLSPNSLQAHHACTHAAYLHPHRCDRYPTFTVDTTRGRSQPRSWGWNAIRTKARRTDVAHPVRKGFLPQYTSPYFDVQISTGETANDLAVIFGPQQKVNRPMRYLGRCCETYITQRYRPSERKR